MNELNHFDKNGNAVMVDVTEKDITERAAIASGIIKMNKKTYDIINEKKADKGDVLNVARIAGIMAAKKTSELIPLCHPLMLTKVTIDFDMNRDKNEIKVFCTTKINWKTGVEMEALTGVTTALLTIYDMCKASDRAMEITSIHLEEKYGGKSGHYKKNNI